ncbi:MAG: AAA family ATPase [Planctomycetes bacterium]|nr:AAA family ATPase [Planctomycetota bacterium]
MAKTIAVSGKGGTGKTTIIALMIRSLLGKSPKAILAVDADANACLGLALGIEEEGTVADLRDKFLTDKNNPSGISKLQAFGMDCESLIAESKGLDLLSMGRPEGPKCYCAVNNILKGFLSRLTGSYGFVITDNEAGMEHLSRRTTDNIDLLIIVAEPTKVGVVTAKRIVGLIDSLPINIAKVGLIWNRTKKDVDIKVNGVEVLGSIPYDDAVYDLSVEGKTIFELDEDNAALTAVRNIVYKELEIEK